MAPTASAPAGPVSEPPHLSASAMVMLAWLIGVMVLSGRLVGTQLRFRARLLRASPLDESKLAVDLSEVRRCAGVHRAIRIVEHDSIAAPSVWGIIRPTIILPRGLASALTAQELRWVLLHELAHVRRGDLIVLTLQRLAAILHFFNPAIWVANRVVHQLREYACDDLAVALGHSSAVESGEAFVRVLRHAGRGRRGLEGALGVFGLDSRASCFSRVRRLLDTERPIRTSTGAWPLGALILFAVVSLPHLRASGEEAREPKAADVPRVPVEQQFELRVVGPGGKPVPDAIVELRTSPAPTAEQIRQGKFVRKATYGPIVTADAEGRLLVAFPRMPTDLNVNITTPGYGPYWADWSADDHGPSVPPRFTAELEAGWSVGGIIVDAGGKPVAETKLRPYIAFKKRPGDLQQLYVGTEIKTDASGRWHFDSVPTSMDKVTFEIHHPAFKPSHRPLTRGEFGIETGREPVGEITLERGLTVIGKVTDEEGRPIAGALVRTKFLNDVREAKTGDDGTYRLTGCEPRAARIVVSARGRATDMKELGIDPDMGPVDFRMKPGGTVRVRVLDEQGNPLPRARIFFQRWRGRFSYFEFDHVSQYADENGVWVWHEAPLDEFRADICPPGETQMQLLVEPLVAREEEYVFRLPAALVVSGKVVDAETKEPVKEFRVVPGIRSSVDHMNWSRGEGFLASGGQYRIRRDRGYLAHLVRIEADGYQAAVSREIKSTEGNLSIDFELKRGRNIAAKVVTPGLQPAAGAKVALGVAGSQINVKNGEIDDGSTYSAREATDADGRFHFPAQDKDFQLVITHPSGYAQIKSPAEWDTVRIIRLEPWARAEGTFRVGPKPAANVPITLQVRGSDSYGEDVPRIFTQHDVTTGPDGRFTFERVIPGKGRIGRRIILMVDDGATEVTSSCMIAADFPAGKIARIDLGGTGRPVVGKLQPPEGFDGKVRWNFALVTAGPDDPEARAAGPHLTATVDRDGTFRIDDVPPGGYSLSVRFQRDDAGRLFIHPFVVPSAGDDAAGPPVDLGTLKLRDPAAR
jgi:BlaR1 peptidase M56/Carboxypeptidase regulatory-like domain